jgi:hypothetical protein
VAPRDVQRGCSWLKGAGAAEAALEELVKSGKGRWLNQGPSANGGRPSRIFDLST